MRSIILVLPVLLWLGCNGNGNNPPRETGGVDQPRPPTDAIVDRKLTDGATADRAPADHATADRKLTDGTSLTDKPPVPDTTAPTRPLLGAQLDRAGRAAIMLTLVNPFNFDGKRDLNLDAYNQNGDPATWGTAHVGVIAQALAVWDVFDGKCGNQSLFTASTGGYAALAALFADDQLYLQTSTGICKQYLAVELGYIKKTPIADCGGRAPSMDVVDTTYGFLGGGTNAPISDNVPFDSVSSDATFPFFGAPN